MWYLIGNTVTGGVMRFDCPDLRLVWDENKRKTKCQTCNDISTGAEIVDSSQKDCLCIPLQEHLNPKPKYIHLEMDSYGYLDAEVCPNVNILNMEVSPEECTNYYQDGYDYHTYYAFHVLSNNKMELVPENNLWFGEVWSLPDVDEEDLAIIKKPTPNVMEVWWDEKRQYAFYVSGEYSQLIKYLPISIKDPPEDYQKKWTDLIREADEENDCARLYIHHRFGMWLRSL